MTREAMADRESTSVRRQPQISWFDWRHETWNRRLIEYYFRTARHSPGPIRRIPATPEELRTIVGDQASDTDEISHAFIRSVTHALEGSNFRAYCEDYRGWTPSSPRPPHFFGMLWFTCLVSYGFPDAKGGFHDRVNRILGRGQQHAMVCLPDLWNDLAEWSRNNRELDVQELELPEPCSFRTIIGFSWFLAYPHRDDRRRLRQALEEAGLIGEDPPIKPALDALQKVARELSPHFRDDLAQFRRRFLETGGDIRKSPFWRAIRQECLGDPIGKVALPQPVLLAAHYDRLMPYVACHENTDLPSGFASKPLPTAIEGFTHFVVIDKGSSTVEQMAGAAKALLDGSLATTTPVSRFAQRGVFVFREASGHGEYVPVAGSEADGVDRALVREDLSEPFREAFGGFERDCLPGWKEIVGCRVVIQEDAPSGLETARHLQATQGFPGPRLVDGIPCENGYLLLSGFLPRIRFDEASKIEVHDASGKLVGQCRKTEPGGDWCLPKRVEDFAPNTFQIRAFYKAGSTSQVATRQLKTVAEHVGHAYKSLPAGRFEIETCTRPGFREVEAEDALPLESSPGFEIPPPVPHAEDETSFDKRARQVREGIAAIASRRKQFHFRELMDLFAVLYPGKSARAKSHLRAIVYAYVASGSIDIVRWQGWRSTIVVARRPRFVSYPSQGGVGARLIGLVPSRLEEEAQAVARRLGIASRFLNATGSKVPAILEIQVEDHWAIDRMSYELGLPQKERSAGFPARIALETCLRDTPIPDQYVPTKRYDFDAKHFVWIEGDLDPDGVQVIRREHPQHHPAFLVTIGGKPFGWSRERNQALLVAYELMTGTIPFDVGSDGSVTPRTSDLFLPIGLARASAIHGSAPPGLRTVQNSDGFHTRISYSFHREHLPLLRNALPFPVRP